MFSAYYAELTPRAVTTAMPRCEHLWKDSAMLISQPCSIVSQPHQPVQRPDSYLQLVLPLSLPLLTTNPQIRTSGLLLAA